MQAKIGRFGLMVSVRPRPGIGSDMVRGGAMLGFAVLTFLGALAVAKPSLALEITPLAGEWYGEGTVTQTKGATEKVRCRVKYKKESAKVYGVTAKCASTTNVMNQTGELLEVKPGVYVGEFNIQKFDVSGRVRVVIEEDTQVVTFKSSRGGGELLLTKQ